MNKGLATLGVLTLLLTASVYADSEHGSEILLEPAFKYLIIKPLINLGICIKHATWLVLKGTSFAENFDKAILYNPPVEGVLPFMDMLLKILFPIFFLLIVSIGFYLLLFSSSPEGRAKAKSMLGKLIITMVLVSISPLIIEAIFEISGGLTGGVFSLTGTSLIRGILLEGLRGMMVFSTWLIVPEGVLGLVPYMLTFVFSWMPYMMISLRNIMLTAMMIAFPLGILCYSIPHLKSIGRSILEQFLVWTFLQVFMALALVSVAKAASYIQLDPNPTINCLHAAMIALPFALLGPVALIVSAAVSLIIEIMASTGMEVPFISTNLETIALGLVAYVVVFVSPLIMVTMFKKFIP